MKIMEAKLGVTTCDKCGEPMAKDQTVIIISEGSITKSNDTLTFDGSCVHYAYHRDCWDRVEEDNSDGL
jgi:hypothetical protein